MPLIFLAVGIVAVVIGMRGQAAAAGQLLASEFTGSNSFVEWFLALAILGGISAYKPARPAANAGIALVLVAMFLAKANPNSASGGFFANLQSAFTTATATAKPSGTTAAGGNSGAPAAGLPTIQQTTQGLNDIITNFENSAGFGPSTSVGKSVLDGLDTVQGWLKGLTSFNFGNAPLQNGTLIGQ